MKQLVITTTSWKALIESLKGNAKHGYTKLESLKQAGGYFTAVLCQDIDASYLERLKIITGEEEVVAKTKWLVDFLNNTITLNISDEPLTAKTNKEVTESLIEFASKQDVGIKIKRTSRKPKQ